MTVVVCAGYLHADKALGDPDLARKIVDCNPNDPIVLEPCSRMPANPGRRFSEFIDRLAGQKPRSSKLKARKRTRSIQRRESFVGIATEDPRRVQSTSSDSAVGHPEGSRSRNANKGVRGQNKDSRFAL